MPEPLLTHNLDHRGANLRLALAGELDLSLADQPQAVLDEALTLAPRTLTLDLAAVAYIDSHSLSLILHADNTATTHRRRLVVVNPPGPARHVMK